MYRTNRALATLAVISVLALSVLVPSALAGGSSAETITACVKDRTGKLRIVDQDTECRRKEHRLDWDRRAEVELPPLEVTLRERSFTITLEPDSSDGPSGIPAACEAGEAVVGGGLTAFDVGATRVDYTAAGPFFDGSRSGWYVEWLNKGDEPVTLSASVTAICLPGVINSVPGL